MRDNEGGCAVIGILFCACIIGPFWAYTYGWDCGVQYMRDKAVTDGHAEYYLDENNARQWRWKNER